MRPALLIAFVCDLATIAIITVAVSVDAALSLQLDAIALVLGGAIAGVELPRVKAPTP